MNRPLFLYWNIVSGVIGGTLIVVGTLFTMLMMAMMGGIMGMMSSWPGAPTTAVWWAMSVGMLLWGAITGTVGLVGALQARNGRSPLGWGIVLAVADVLSFPIMGGFLVGGLAAIAAGILAIVAATPKTETSPTSAASP